MNYVISYTWNAIELRNINIFVKLILRNKIEEIIPEMFFEHFIF